MYTVITLHHSLLRSIAGIVMGLLFILWPEESVNYLIIATGIFFVLSGVCSVLLWAFRRGEGSGTFSVPLVWVAVTGSILLGTWLIVSPGFFVEIFGRAWGVILAIAGVQQIVSLFKAKKRYPVPLGYYVIPALILLAGATVLLYPLETVVNTFMLLGVVSLFYGVNELIGRQKFRPVKAEILPDETVDAEV
jgi:uncharacterized membrane protein HdeD (DUF308 family)